MVNLTMNTNTRKSIEDNRDKLHWYLWRKEWVRPYESIFSVIRNFCKINVINAIDLLNKLELNQTNSGLFNGYLMCGCNITLKKQKLKPLFDILLPDNYFDTLKIFNTNNEELNRTIIERQFVYCPKCMSENYHSMYHNIVNMDCCVFHKQPLIHSNISFDLRSIRYSDGKDADMNVRNAILPCERKFKNNVFSLRREKYDIFIPIAKKKQENINYINIEKTFKDNNTADREFKIPVYKNSLFEFNERFLNWFIVEQKMCHSLVYESQGNRFRTSDISALVSNSHFKGYSHYVNLFLYYKFREAIRASGMDNYIKDKENNMPILKDHELYISVEDKELICGSFIAAVLGTWHLADTFNSYWVMHPTSSLNGLRKRNKEINLLSIIDDIPQNCIGINDCTMVQIVLAILNDQYDYMYTQAFNKVLVNKKVVAYNIDKGLVLPEYYICHCEKDDYYKILRYNKSQEY